MKFIPFVLAAALIMSDNLSVGQGSGQSKISGIVTDINNARVSGATVEFIGKRYTSKVLTSDDGTYEVHLLPGTYNVSVSKFGFCDRHRGTFLLKTESEVRFNFQLPVCAIWDSEGIPSTSTERLPDRYQEEELSAIANGVRPLVMFGKRETHGLTIQYAGFEYHGRKYPVVYTYDLLTIEATTLIYTVRNNSVEAIGDVVWQDGTQEQRGTRAHVLYVNKKPQIHLDE